MVANITFENGTQTVTRNLEQNILFQQQTLQFLVGLRHLKRPCTSLRVGGLKCFPEKDRMKLISQFETCAMEHAIKLKKKELAELEHEFNTVPESEWHLYDPPNHGILAAHQAKLTKKDAWLNHLSKTRFSDWPEKPVFKSISGSGKKARTAACKAARNKRKKEKKKRKRLEARVERVKRENLVFNLVAPEKLAVPDEALAVLSYGPGFVATPGFDQFRFRLDGFNARNRLEKLANDKSKKLKSVEEEEEEEKEEEPVLGIEFVFPRELMKRDVVSQKLNGHNDPVVQQVLTDMGSFTDNLRPPSLKHNLSSHERSGLKWLKEHTNDGSLCVCKADKGGAIILVETEIVSSMIEKKVSNPEHFDCLGAANPLPGIMSEMRWHWVNGVRAGIIPMDMAARTVGITKSMVDSNRGKPSTLDLFKPGTPCFSVLPKIHKLEVKEILPGVELPFRMITDLSKGPTARADKFISVNFLRTLQEEYCKDLLQDTTMLLQKLDLVERDLEIEGSRDFLFTIDFEQLYDSLSRDVVFLALREAIDIYRPDWDRSTIEWVISSVKISLDSAVGKYGVNWYKAKDGVPTGGKLCVYLANIAVFYVCKRAIAHVNYSTNILYFLRFIDDCTGSWRGSLLTFYIWFVKFYNYLDTHFGLRITFEVVPANNFIAFLDIRYRFVEGVLDTDVYYKPTDAHRYLNFQSFHPPHVFRSTVYSQFLRLRRIIIDNSVLYYRLVEMKKFFIHSDYPVSLVDEILFYVLKLDRCIVYADKSVPSSRFEVPWVTTYGPGFSETRDYVKRTNKVLTKSLLFKECTNPVLGVVSRRAPNLKDTLFSQRSICLGTVGETTLGKITTRCRPLGTKRAGKPCGGCDLMSGKDHISIGNKTLHCSGGTCTSNNLVYGVQCVICDKAYIGKTVQTLRSRITGHRSFMQKLDTNDLELSDENTLAAHLISDHNLATKDSFNNSYRFTILRVVADPKFLTLEEQKLVNFFSTLRPNGLNFANPVNIGINYLGRR